MNLFTRIFKKLPKRLFGLIAVVLAVALPVASFAADSVRLEGSLGVANVTAGDTQYQRSVNASYDQVVKLQVYYHNQENPDSGKNANNLRVKVAIPSTPGKTQVARATISADNANTVNDQVTINLDRDDAYLEYIPGSAVWRHNAGTNENVNYVEQKISDEVVYGGQGAIIENAQPCFNFGATITVLARVRVPGVSVDKQVRVKGTTEWKTSNTAKPGETLEYQIAYKNQGNTTHKNVVIRDNLPPKLTYIPGSTKIMTSNGVSNVADGITATGLDVGNYSPGAAAYALFEVKVPEEKDLECGVTEFRNVGVARPEGMNEFYNTAITKVEKKCKPTPPEKPEYSCDLLEVKQPGGRKIEASVKYTAKDGATFKDVTYNFGDGSTPLVTDQTAVEYTYAQDGEYTITATVRFTVNGQDKTDTNESCTKKVAFKSDKPVPPAPTPTPTPTPGKLPDTGAGEVIGIFVATTIVGTLAYRVLLARRYS